jgi:hypothetical protein
MAASPIGVWQKFFCAIVENTTAVKKQTGTRSSLVDIVMVGTSVA